MKCLQELPDRFRRAAMRQIRGGFRLAASWLAVLLLSAAVLPASSNASSKDTALTPAMKEAIIERVATTLDEHYIIVDLAKDMGRELRRRFASGDYDDAAALDEFTERLTADLRDISHDLHILILPYEKLPDYRFEDRLVGTPRENYGFRRVELLPGNIGYLEISKFFNTREAGATAVAAMNFLAHCDALIIDLRRNGGGDGTMAQLISSYLFESPTLMTREYGRKDEVRYEMWTQGYVPGPLLADVPVYILLSDISFSMAEEFSYDLKHLGRATIVGMKTKGGGHSVTYKSYPKEMINVRVPVSRSIHPVTGTGFQDIGVMPDIEASYSDSFAVANREALKRLLAEEKIPERRFKLQWALDEYEAALAPKRVDESALAGYFGQYGERRISTSCGKLTYRRLDGPPRVLLPIGTDIFTFESERSYSSLRVGFVRNDSGEVSGLYLIDDDDDRSEAYPRTPG